MLKTIDDTDKDDDDADVGTQTLTSINKTWLNPKFKVVSKNNRSGELSFFVILSSHTRQIPCEYLFRRLPFPSKASPVHFSSTIDVK